MKKAIIIVLSMLLLTTLASASISTYDRCDTSEHVQIDPPSLTFYVDEVDVPYWESFTFNSSVIEIENAEYIQWFTLNGAGQFDDEQIEHPTYYPSPIIDYPQGYTIIGVAVANSEGHAGGFIQLNYV